MQDSCINHASQFSDSQKLKSGAFKMHDNNFEQKAFR